MTGLRLIVPMLVAFLFNGVAQAEGMDDKQFNAIQQLGGLNGVALNCRFLSETQRMKKALVLALPKRRQYGEAFDQETNTAFLKFIETKASCPVEADFSKQVDAAILVLDSVFAGQ
ncbi:hypothetical protein [Sedimenticola hydrogenitrophicus]|uniref:hypothetical protein n=1 Tax=Sedimenticola hydrogenitrophicus TaxID=2967975 RepID=UPI0023AE7839|nr:hypothetical protein [Sedimenticola hydrogenitrophicus]